jgi:enoyl-CoA hydratase
LSSDLSYDKQGRVAWLRLCRPQQGNRLTPAVAAEFTVLCETVADEDEIDIVVLTGTGEVFCLGLEYAAGKQGPAAAQEIRSQFGELRAVDTLAALTKPTLAVLNGDAVGVGLELALACDLRLAVANAHFGLPQVGEGLIPFCGGTQRLPRVVGQAKALELILTGNLIGAQEAFRLGLVNEVIAANSLTTRVDEILTGLLGKGPIALRSRTKSDGPDARSRDAFGRRSVRFTPNHSGSGRGSAGISREKKAAFHWSVEFI